MALDPNQSRERSQRLVDRTGIWKELSHIRIK
jgi:hypothetical protein